MGAGDGRGPPRDCSPCRDRRPRVGPSTVRATSHRNRIGKRMPCATVRAMQPDSTRAGDTDRRPPSGPMMDTPPPRNRVAADDGPYRGDRGRTRERERPPSGESHVAGCPPRGCPESRPPRRPCRDMAGAGSGALGGCRAEKAALAPPRKPENPPIVFYPCSTIV